MYCIDINREIAEAAESARVLDACHAHSVGWMRDERTGELIDIRGIDPRDVYEAAEERAGIAAERGVGVGGLVSVPTSGKRLGAASSARTAGESESLRRAMRATEIDKRKGRVSKLRRAVGFSARAIGAALDRPGFRAHYVAMLTLTYARDEWEPRHLSDLLQHVRKYLKGHGARLHYVWVAELQRRGVIHYHLALWLPAGVTIPKPDKRGWWPHGSTNIEEARRAVPYLLKYMSKGLEFAGFPKGARLYGSGGLDHTFKRARRWLGLPSFVKARADIFDDWRRAVGGGWSDPDGTVIPSEYARLWIGDRWSVMQVAAYGRPFEADGPFTWISRSPYAR